MNGGLEELDLRDPVTANAVADAIVRYLGGGYVPLSARYPWEFRRREDPLDDIHMLAVAQIDRIANGSYVPDLAMQTALKTIAQLSDRVPPTQEEFNQ